MIVSKKIPKQYLSLFEWFNPLYLNDKKSKKFLNFSIKKKVYIVKFKFIKDGFKTQDFVQVNIFLRIHLNFP